MMTAAPPSGDPARPKVSVIVPHYQDMENLGACLDALERQGFPRDHFEIVIGDNGSPCGIETVEAIAKGRARVVVQPEKGAGAARNMAAAAAQGEVLAFTDADCRPHPGWIEAGLTCLAQADFVGGAMVVSVGAEDAMTSVEAFERVFAFDNRAYVHDKRFSVTANMFVPRALFETVGGFRARVSEDLDWCLRAGDMGHRIRYCPGAVVEHPARRDWGELIRKWDRISSELYALHRARGGGSLSWLGRTWLLPLSAIGHLPKVIRSRAIAPRDRMGAAVVLLRLRLWRFVRGHRLLIRG